MAWVRIDDSFYEAEKWSGAPADSVGLWVAAMAWCNRHDEREDARQGIIPDFKVRALLAVRNIKATLGDLCERRAFHRVDGGYQIHDYEQYQQNEKVQRIRSQRSKAGKAGAAARWASDGKPMANAIANDMANANDDGCPVTRNPLPESWVSSERVPTSLPTGDGGGDNSERIARIAKAYGQHAATKANARSENYWRKAAERVLSDPKLYELAERFPSAPDQVIAAALHGETNSLRYFEEQPAESEPADLAPVTPLRRTPRVS